MILKIHLNKDIEKTIDVISERKMCNYRYYISEIRDAIEIWMEIDDDEICTFCESMAKYYHIDNFDVLYKRHKWEYRDGKILRKRMW